jgi:hypothetical protein
MLWPGSRPCRNMSRHFGVYSVARIQYESHPVGLMPRPPTNFTGSAIKVDCNEWIPNIIINPSSGTAKIARCAPIQLSHRGESESSLCRQPKIFAKRKRDRESICDAEGSADRVRCG